jgi:NADH dehydrogenase
MKPQGGGFAGVRTALELNEYLRDNDEYEITLVDKRDYHLYNPGLYEAATAEHDLVQARKVKKTVAIPHAKIFRNTKVKVFKAYVDNVDLEDGLVVTDSRILNYTYLVVALGSVPDFYGIPSLEKYGFTLKSLEDAIMIRNRVEDIVTKKGAGRIIVGGGGFAGAEFAGELHNLVKHECQFHGKDPRHFEIMIVEGGTGLIPALPPNVTKMAGDRLSAMGIQMRFSTLITEAGGSFVVLNNKEKLDCDLLVWTGGVRSTRMPGHSDVERDKKDRLLTTNFLNLKKMPNVFVCGDNLGFIDPATKRPLPQTAQEAIRQAKTVSRNIFRMIKKQQVLPYMPGVSEYVIPVTGKYSIFYSASKNLVIQGVLGWIIRRFADLRYFLGILPLGTALRFWMFENKIFIKND